MARMLFILKKIIIYYLIKNNSYALYKLAKKYKIDHRPVESIINR